MSINQEIHTKVFGLKCGLQIWVVNKDGSNDLTVPFKAMDMKHATEWINQGYVKGKYKIEPRPDCPLYDSDMSEAFKVVDKMRALGYSWELNHRILDKQIWASFSKNEIHWVAESGETAAEAICKAALMTVK